MSAKFDTRLLPPGPRTPRAIQTVALTFRQRPYLERQRRKYGETFTVRIAGFMPLVAITNPEHIKQVFTADPKVLHAGDTSPLRPVLGRNSLLGIDEDRHLAQRRLLLPPFKGQRMKAYESLIEEIASDEIDKFPEGVEFAIAPAMQRLTLRAILRAVFGATGRELAELEELLPPWTEQGSKMAMTPFLQRDLGPRSPWGAFLRLRGRIDAILDRLIAMAKNDARLEERTDVLALLVQATHEDGTPMSNEEIRDQLVTMLAAGHETTAHQLSWTVERLTRTPHALERLVAEVDEGTSKRYLDATIRESQRTRPVIFFAGRTTMEPYSVAGYDLPRGVQLALAAAMTHFDPRLFDRPDQFLPERFVDARPETYSWIPFGGGIRRCIGATFAHMEMDVVLRTLLSRVELLPTSAPPERWAFRGVAMAPAEGGRVVVRRRRSSSARGAGPAPVVEAVPAVA
ncbi:MAG TPA: cytochrome P450 [Solirubrobacteraceae bacterium]|nr:cytochrome P450 [Solirubrobacteraceae bacterium]